MSWALADSWEGYLLVSASKLSRVFKCRDLCCFLSKSKKGAKKLSGAEIGISGAFSDWCCELAAIMVRPLRAASLVNSFVMRSAKIPKYWSSTCWPRIGYDVLIREEAVSRQQCLTSVSILTRPSFSIMMPFSVLTEARYVGSTVPEFYERRALRKELATRRPSKTTFEYSCSIDFLRNSVISEAEFAKFGAPGSSSFFERNSLLSTPSELIVGSKLDRSSIVF